MLVELAAAYVDILNEHPRNPTNFEYALSREKQRQMIMQELNYGFTYSKSGITKESIFEYASRDINNFGMIKLMTEWWPKLEQLQELYKERKRYTDEMKNFQNNNTYPSFIPGILYDRKREFKDLS